MAARSLGLRLGWILGVLVVAWLLLRPWGSGDAGPGDGRRSAGPTTRTELTTKDADAPGPVLRGEGTPADPGSAATSDVPASRTVRVHVTFEGDLDAASGPRRAHIGLGPAGKRDRGREVWCWVEDGATAEMVVPAAGPLRLRWGAAPWAAHRAPLEIPVGQDEVGLLFVAACNLDVEVFDATNDLPLGGDLAILVRSLETEEVVERVSSVEDLRWRLRTPRLSTGSYRVEVTAAGYRPAPPSDVHLRRPGERGHLAVKLSPETGTGRLLLEVEPPVGGTLEGACFSVEGMRRDAEKAVWISLPPRTLDAATARMILGPLIPGDHRLLVWAGRDLVGRLEDVTIHANQTTEASVRLAPGLLLPLADLPWRPLFYSHSRQVLLSTRDAVPLPTLYFESRLPSTGRGWGVLMSRFAFRDERALRVGSRPPGLPEPGVEDGAVLGPYPFEAVVLREGTGPATQEHVFEVE